MRMLLAATMALCACSSGGEIEVRHDPVVGDVRGFTISTAGGISQAVGVYEAQGQLQLQVVVMAPGIARAVSVPGEQGQFTVGGQVLSLSSAFEARPIVGHTAISAGLGRASGGDVYTVWKLGYLLGREDAARFAAGPLTAVKVQVGPQWYEIALEAAQAQKFQANMMVMTRSPAPAPAE
jgi:hypothetical protein